MTPDNQTNRTNRFQLAIVSLILFSLIVFLQWKGGAYESEFGGHPDEAAHYVTGLMIRDYFADGFPGHPKKYADNYYAHYPKVALGNWPPLFYLMQTAWTLPFGPQRTSVFLFMAVLTTAVGMVLFEFTRRRYGFSAGMIAALLLVLAPLIQRHTSMLMTEIPIALFSFSALWFLGRYFEANRTRDSVLFGIFASLAILTKGSGMFLALVPGLSILLTRNFKVLTRLNFWYPAVIVSVLCGPWTFAFRKIARAGWMEDSPTMRFTSKAVQFYPSELLWSVGIALSALAVVGIVGEFKSGKQDQNRLSRTAVLASAIVSLLIFHGIVPVGLEDRHLIPILPIVIYFAVAGAQILGSILARRTRAPEATVLMAAAAVFLVLTFEIPVKGYSGFREPALMLLDKAPDTKTKFLVSSDAPGEGMFIAEVAMHEKRPGHIVQRTSKALSSSTWSGSGYSAKFQDEQAVVDFINAEDYRYIIVDKSIPEFRLRPHHTLLNKTVEQFPDRFTLLQEYSIQRKGITYTNAAAVYEFMKTE